MNETVGAYLSQGLSIDLNEARELATRHGLEYGSMVHNLDEDAHGVLQRLIVEHAASQEHINPTIETRLGPVVERVRLLFRRYILQLQPHRFQGVEGPAIERSILGFLSQPPLDASSQEVLQSVQEVLDDDDRWSMDGTQTLVEGVHEPWMHLGDLSMTLSLSDLERDLLWLLLTPEVEPRFLWMYRCVTGRQEQVSWQESFLQALVDPSGAQLARVRNALSAQGKLLRMGLVRVHSPNHLATDRRLRVDARLVQRILGVPLQSGPVDGLGRFLAADDLEREDPFDIFPAKMRSKMQKILRKKRRIVLVAPPGSGALRLVRRIQAGPGDPLIRVHAEELVEGGSEAVAAVLRETLLERAGLFVHDFEALESERLKLPAWKLDALLEHLALCQTPLFIASSSTLSARMQHRVASALNAETVALPALEASTRADLWRRHLTDVPLEEDLDTIVTQAHTWPLDVDDIERAVQIASAQARQRASSSSQATVALDDIEAACSEMTTPKLRTLAVRVRTRFSWDDIILPEATSESLKDLINFGRYSDLVLNEWDFARKMPYGRGLSAMLSGPSGYR